MNSPAYKPEPIDTSRVKIHDDMRAKIEELAKNNHEVWARERMAEGWHWGPKRDDDAKTHPSLVPYQQLSESEKDIDRATVLQTLKAAMATGYVRALTVPASSVDDLYDPVDLPAELRPAYSELLDLYGKSASRAQTASATVLSCEA